MLDTSGVCRTANAATSSSRVPAAQTGTKLGRNLVSALVCTRNRPNGSAKTVRSLLADNNEDLELVVIDQSDNGETENALRGWRDDKRFVYHHTQSRGKGRALNEGLTLSRRPILVCTDDDCEVPPGWPSAIDRKSVV